MISFNIKNASSGPIGPIEFRMEVVDKDKKSVFAGGLASVPSIDVPPGHTKRNRHRRRPRHHGPRPPGDMHEMAFSTIHFAIWVTATVGRTDERRNSAGRADKRGACPRTRLGREHTRLWTAALRLLRGAK